jgi:hypothetical protein
MRTTNTTIPYQHLYNQNIYIVRMKHAEIISSQKAPQRIPSNTPLACPCPRAKQSIIQNAQIRTQNNPRSQTARWVSRGPHVGPSGDAPGYVSPVARSYFLQTEAGFGPRIARLPCFFSLSSTSLPAASFAFASQDLPPVVSFPRPSPAPDFRRRLALSLSAKTHSHTLL